jgi:hypothetical protein
MWSYYSSPWSVVLLVIALTHFFKRRPDAYWLWVIVLLGPLGSMAYVFMEVIPDLGLLRGSFETFPRRKRIKDLESAVLDNPSAGNYEELGDLYLEDKKYKRALDCFNKSISSRTDSPDPFYRRGICHLELGNMAEAKDDFERVYKMDPKYDFHRAAGLYAHALARTGDREHAAQIFEQVTATSILSETQYNYATLLAEMGRKDEARELAQRLLSKRNSMPGYLKRRERPWFRRAKGLLRQLPSA